MPNYVTHRMTIQGPAEKLAAFHERFVGHGQDYSGSPVCFLDFDKIIPQPEILQETKASSETDMGLAALKGEGFERYLGFQYIQDAGVTDLASFRDWVSRNKPEAIKAAEKSLQAEEETGCKDWYQWCIKNWGTKWNSAHGHWEHEEGSETAVLMFDTAWSPASPIFAALADLCDGLEFEIHAFDEGWCFAYKASIEDGVFDEESVEANDEMYEAVYGHPPEREEGEEDEEETAA